MKDFEILLAILSTDVNRGKSDSRLYADDSTDDGLQEEGSKLFLQMDTDGDGELSEIEVMNWLTKNGVEPDFGIVAALMKYFDRDGDGHITLEDLINRNQEGQFGIGMAYFPGKVNEVAECFGTFAKNENGTKNKRKSLKKKKDVNKFLGKLSLVVYSKIMFSKTD